MARARSEKNMSKRRPILSSTVRLLCSQPDVAAIHTGMLSAFKRQRPGYESFFSSHSLAAALSGASTCNSRTGRGIGQHVTTNQHTSPAYRSRCASHQSTKGEGARETTGASTRPRAIVPDVRWKELRPSHCPPLESGLASVGLEPPLRAP